MFEVKLGPNGQDLLQSWQVPYTLRVYNVSEELFDDLVDEDTRAELLDGVMIVHSPASLERDDIAGFIRTLMRAYAARRRFGKVLGPDSIVHLASCRKFAPDLFFVQAGRLPSPRPKEFEGSPDLVLEMLSPSNRDFDLNDKRAAYRQAGVREIWFIDAANQQVLVDRRRGKRYVEEVIAGGRVTSAVLQGFWLEVDWLWEDPLPDELDCLQAILNGSESR
jgi:Uma2 family endonuclease